MNCQFRRFHEFTPEKTGEGWFCRHCYRTETNTTLLDWGRAHEEEGRWDMLANNDLTWHVFTDEEQEERRVAKIRSQPVGPPGLGLWGWAAARAAPLPVPQMVSPIKLVHSPIACPYCGFLNLPGNIACSNCGSSFPIAAPPSPPTLPLATPQGMGILSYACMCGYRDPKPFPVCPRCSHVPYWATP